MSIESILSNLYVRGIKIKDIEEDVCYKHLPAIKSIIEQEELKFSSNVTFLVGENGMSCFVNMF